MSVIKELNDEQINKVSGGKSVSDYEFLEKDTIFYKIGEHRTTARILDDYFDLTPETYISYERRDYGVPFVSEIDDTFGEFLSEFEE